LAVGNLQKMFRNSLAQQWRLDDDNASAIVIAINNSVRGKPAFAKTMAHCSRRQGTTEHGQTARAREAAKLKHITPRDFQGCSCERMLSQGLWGRVIWELAPVVLNFTDRQGQGMARGEARLLPVVVHLLTLMKKYNVSPADLDERFVGRLQGDDGRALPALSVHA